MLKKISSAIQYLGAWCIVACCLSSFASVPHKRTVLEMVSTSKDVQNIIAGYVGTSKKEWSIPVWHGANRISAIAFSLSGKQVAVTGDLGKIMIFYIAENEDYNTLCIDIGQKVVDIAFTRDDACLRVTILNRQGHEIPVFVCIRTARIVNPQVRNVHCYNPPRSNNLVRLEYKPEAEKYRLCTPQADFEISHMPRYKTTCALSPRGSLLAQGKVVQNKNGQTISISLRDVENPASVLKTIRSTTYNTEIGLMDVTFSSQDAHIALLYCMGPCSYIVVWSTQTGNRVAEAKIDGYWTRVNFAPDDQTVWIKRNLWAGQPDFAVYPIIDIKKSATVDYRNCKAQYSPAYAYSPLGDLLATTETQKFPFYPFSTLRDFGREDVIIEKAPLVDKNSQPSCLKIRELPTELEYPEDGSIQVPTTPDHGNSKLQKCVIL